MKDVILIDKPAGWTSFDVVAKVRSHIRKSYADRGEKPTKRQLRVGHAGTLDPFATGLLILLLGDACKEASTYLKLDKTYEFTATLGATSSTGDPEGEITEVAVETTPTEEVVLKTLTELTGEITQTPPVYSAIKINGQRAYKLAREGKSVEMPTRQVTISRLQLVEYDFPYVKCICDVSSGTYIRTLVGDIGNKLGTGAYCNQLRRTRIGEYSISESKTLEAVLTNQ